MASTITPSKSVTIQWLYLIGHHSDQIPSTHINYTADPYAALAQHNSGKVHDTRRAAGHWQILLLICVPSIRQIDVAKLAVYWRRQSRTIHHRFVFGMSTAANLLLLCFANGKTLREAKTVNKKDQRLLDKVLTRLIHNNSNNSDDIDQRALQRRVRRYIESPHSIYKKRRHLPTPSPAEKVVRLDQFNTIDVDAPICFSTKIPSYVSLAANGNNGGEDDDDDDDDNGGGGDDDDDDDDNDDVEEEEDEVADALAATQRTNIHAVRLAPAKRAKRAMAIVYNIVDIQQSGVFKDGATTRVSATTDTTNRPDNKLVRHYGDALCVDMQSANTLANMKAIDGSDDARCICGTAHVLDDKQSTVVLASDKQPLCSHRCKKCGRIAATYTRFCIDPERVGTAMQVNGIGASVLATTAPTRKQGLNKSTSNDDVSTDSLDLFVQTLLISFSADDGGTVECGDGPARRRPLSETKTRRQLFKDGRTTANGEMMDVDDERAPHNLIFGSHTVTCDHATLEEVVVPAADAALISHMFSGSNQGTVTDN